MKKVYGVLSLLAVSMMMAIPSFAAVTDGPVQLRDTQMAAVKGESAAFLNLQGLGQFAGKNSNQIGVQILGDRNIVIPIIVAPQININVLSNNRL